MLADIAIIGGSPQERIVWAINLRRKGFAVHTETVDRKRDKMFKRALEEAGNKEKIYDVNDPAKAKQLTKLVLAEVRIETRRVLVFDKETEE